MIRDLIAKNRTCRRFEQDFAIDRRTLRELVDLARLSASAGNIQPLKYILSWESEKNALIFPDLGWAGYLEDWPGPAEGERPSAYIIMLGDTELHKSFDCDAGIAAQSILIGAAEKGLAGCIIALVQREQLRNALDIPAHCKILVVLALGKPREKVVLELLAPDGDIKYYRDRDGTHHVPKRALDEIIID
ncbi:MAG: nitroreductase family protein [Planctomycetes bacterium]|nr:nitroreductase family protein [Planctomycetota bacterium]